MSSPEPYQSRLLNFLNRQSIKWREHLEISARKIKTVTSWSLQLLLYPIYFLVQTGRLAQRQLTSGRVSNFQLPSSALLENVLESLDTPSTVLLACDLENRQLVFTKDQEIIALSAPEKQRIKRLIYQELVEYHKKVRLQKRREKSLPNLLVQSSQIWPPLRFFWQTLAWVEKGELATTLNLFNESKLSRQDNLELLLHSQYFARTLLELIQAALDYFLSLNKKTPTFPQFNKLYLESKNYLISLKSSLNSHSDPFQIKYIIYAALEYFFLEKNKAKKPISTSDNEPWLAWEDFFPGLVTSLPSSQEKAIMQPEKTSEWIETEIIDLGYVENSLEKTIKWLDRVSFKIEKVWMKFWKWLSRLKKS